MAEKLKGMMGSSFGFTTGEDASPPEMQEGPVFPLRVLFVTPLVPTRDHNAGAAAPETPLQLDLKEPDALLERLKPRAAFEVESALRPGEKERVDFAPRSLKAFRPDALVEGIGLLARLRDGRTVAAAAAAGEMDPQRARNELSRLWNGSPLVDEVLGIAPAAAAPAQAPASFPKVGGSEGDDAVDALLAMVDMPGAPPQEESSNQVGTAMREIIRQVTAGRKAPRGLSGAVARADGALAAQLVAILRHEELRRLERSYRALRLVAERSAGIAGVIVDVLDPGDATVVEAVENALGKVRGQAYAFVVTDEVVDGSARSLETMTRLADVGESTATPILMSCSAALLGLEDLARLDTIDNKQGLFDARERAPWRSAAFKPAMQWVALALNDVLLRTRYDTASSRLRGIAFAEPDGDPLTARPALILALCAIASFRDTGFPSRIVGARAGTVGDLPVHEIDDQGTTVAIPTVAFVSTETQREVSRLGITTIAAAPNTDAAYVHVAPTAYVVPPKRTYDSATTEPEHRPPAIPLGDQLFVAHVVHFTRALAAGVTDDLSEADATELLGQALPLLFDKAPPSGPEIAVRVRREGDGRVAVVQLSPRRFAGVTLEEVAFEMPLG